MSWNFDNLDDFVAEDVLRDNPEPDRSAPAAAPCHCQCGRAPGRGKPPAAAANAPPESQGPTLAQYIMFSNRILRAFPDALRTLIEASRVEYPDPLLAAL